VKIKLTFFEGVQDLPGTVVASLPEDVDGPSASRRSPSPDISEGKSSDVDWETDINRSAGLLQDHTLTKIVIEGFL
jgi:hypothetical protein